MVKRAMLYLSAACLSLAGIVCLGGGCELPKRGLGDYSSDELIDELLDRGAENLGDLFDDLDGLFGDDD